MPNLDPLSQLIGGLTAQISELQRAMTSLQSDVITNRSQSQEWREKHDRSVELLHAEMRNLKHDHRGYETGSVALDHRLAKMDERLAAIEDVVKAWKTRAAIIVSIAVGIGFVLEIAGPVALTHILSKW